MKTVELTAVVAADRTVTLRLPADIAPGEHRLIITIDANVTPNRPPESSWPVHDVGPWPADLTLRREDLYGEWGR